MQQEAKQVSAAYNLEGRILLSGWKVEKLLEKSAISTGGHFSVCYIVEKEGQTAFLKAIDFLPFFQSRRNNITEIMKEMLDAYHFEKNLLSLCKDKRLTKVSTFYEAEVEFVEGFPITQVPYIIFELAEGDIRHKLNDFKPNDLNLTWKLRSLHNISVGLKQLHSTDTGHQDLKPSNILTFRNNICKIGDLGRSVNKSIIGPHSDYDFAGDVSYAPFEILYAYSEKEWKKRIVQIDAYLLGSMITFYFTGSSMNSIFFRLLNSKFNFQNWKGTYTEILPYLLENFDSVINEFSQHIPNDYYSKELSVLVYDLCNPDINKRGQKGLKNGNSIISLDPYISRLDVLAQKAKWNLHHKN